MKSIDELYQTEEGRKEAIALFESLLANQGWLLLKQIIEYNKKLIENKLLSGSKKETIEEIRALRDELGCYNDFLNTPTDQIEKLKDSEIKDNNFDPYE